MLFSHFCAGLVSTSLVRFKKSNIDIDKSLKGGEEFSPPPGGGPHSRVPQNFVLFPTLGECGEYVLSMQLLPWHNVLRNCHGNNFFKRFKIYPLIYPNHGHTVASWPTYHCRQRPRHTANGWGR